MSSGCLEVALPVSVIVGGQFGSEGKGKVSAHVARERKARAIVRVGGTNSGHTAVDSSGVLWTLRQLPAGLVESPAVAILPAGSLIDIDILLAEIERLKLSPDKLWIDTRASIITPEHRAAEQALIGAIGSTSSGTGAALSERLARSADHVRAASISELGKYLREDTVGEMRAMLQAGDRLVMLGRYDAAEGTSPDGSPHQSEPIRPALSRIKPRLKKTKTSSARGCMSRRTTILASVTADR